MKALPIMAGLNLPIAAMALVFLAHVPAAAQTSIETSNVVRGGCVRISASRPMRCRMSLSAFGRDRSSATLTFVFDPTGEITNGTISKRGDTPIPSVSVQIDGSQEFTTSACTHNAGTSFRGADLPGMSSCVLGASILGDLVRQMRTGRTITFRSESGQVSGTYLGFAEVERVVAEEARR